MTKAPRISIMLKVIKSTAYTVQSKVNHGHHVQSTACNVPSTAYNSQGTLYNAQSAD